MAAAILFQETFGLLSCLPSMKILITGANGYIGKRIIPDLLQKGHEIVCCVRDKNRLSLEPAIVEQVSVAEGDFLQPETLDNLPQDIDAAYYLIHSMSSSIKEFMEMEETSARNFVSYIEKTNARQIIYLSGLINESVKLSPHLQSRYNVEQILSESATPHTVLRAGIIVGSGSASFEIVRDLVEKLPVMIAPRWIDTKTQPIGIRDVLHYLTEVIGKEETYSRAFDVGGPEVLTYKEMMLQYAEVRNLNRHILTVPVMTPRLSSYWLYFVTSTSYKLAVNLVNSMKVDVVCKEHSIRDIIKTRPESYKKAIERAFERIDHHTVASSWKDAFISSSSKQRISDFIQVPEHGVFKDQQIIAIKGDEKQVLKNIWSLGGNAGWYYANGLWAIRGALDKAVGGVGLRRGRTNPDAIHPGDVLDFWRVIVADYENRRLLLFAEMKLPGEAWLEFRISNHQLIQTATFRPKGLWGRIYWHLMLPFHYFIFRRMAKNIATK